ncbi:MAG: hypothetical protein ABI670_19650 [Chloroflexota bacterium]
MDPQTQPQAQPPVSDRTYTQAELDAHLQHVRNQSAAYQIAASLGVTDSALLERVLDWNSVTTDDKGKPTNLDTVVKDTVSKLKAAVGTTQQPTTPTSQPINPPANRQQPTPQTAFGMIEAGIAAAEK